MGHMHKVGVGAVKVGLLFSIPVVAVDVAKVHRVGMVAMVGDKAVGVIRLGVVAVDLIPVGTRETSYVSIVVKGHILQGIVGVRVAFAKAHNIKLHIVLVIPCAPLSFHKINGVGAILGQTLTTWKAPPWMVGKRMPTWHTLRGLGSLLLFNPIPIFPPGLA
jgi:hypothetical protein